MKRKPWLLAVLLLPLLSCRPGADFKVSVRVIDEATGKPIPDAWVLAAVAVKVEPEREPPYNRAVAGARAKTDSRGIAVFNKIEGIYWGEEPKDKLWLMLESRKPKLKRRITLIKEGDLFVFAKDYGALHHPLHFKGTPQEHAGMGPFGIKGEDKALLLDPSEMKDGAVLTVKMAKPDQEYLYGSFHPDTFLPAVWAATSEKTGASKAEKRAVYDFFVRNLAPLDMARPEGADRGHIKPEALLDPEVIEHFVNHAPARDQNTAIQEWMTQKALELLPPGYEEVKEYAQEILAGVREEEEGDRPLNHYYDPSEPDKAMPGGETALKWGAIGYPDNPRNEWDWEDALRYYRAGEKARAYRALGHVVHLLADMAMAKPAAIGTDQTAGLDAVTRDMLRTAEGPAFARTLRGRFEVVANQSLGEPKAAITSAIAQVLGLFLDFNRRLHPPAFVAATDGGGGWAQDFPQTSGSAAGESSRRPEANDSPQNPAVSAAPPTRRLKEMNSTLHPVGFGIRRGGGIIRLLFSHDLSGKRLEIVDVGGKIVKQWSGKQYDRFGISRNGKFAFVARLVPAIPASASTRTEEPFIPYGPPRTTPPEPAVWAEESTPRYDFEVLDADGNSLWRQLLSAYPSYYISDAGLLFQVSEGRFALYGRNGKRTVSIPAGPGDLPEYFFAWSPDGETIVIAHRVGGRLRCLRGGRLVYELQFQDKEQPTSPSVLGVWNDCGAVMTLSPLPFHKDTERLLVISPDGQIIRREALDYATYQQNALMGEDGVFAYASTYGEEGQVVLIGHRNTPNPPGEYRIPRGEAVDSIILGKSPEDLSLVCRNINKIHKNHPDAKATKHSGYWIRFVRQGQLQEEIAPLAVHSAELVLHDEVRNRLHVLDDDGPHEVSEP